MQSFYVTTPIYYVNDRPHIGHAYTTILADVLARYHRLMGTPTFFLTGTDEHGQKVQRAAEAAGITPREQADRTVVRFQDLWRRLEITSDDFIRTTEARHTRVVQQILQDLYNRDEIYRAEYDGWYCVTCERFYTDKDLKDGCCPEPGCGRVVERIREANYFFRMSAYQDWLIRTIRERPGFIQPDFRRNETLGFLRQPLNDLCISRPKNRLTWGIELPFDADYVTYVWFDALVNYISAIGYPEDRTRFERWWPATYHLIGKDILTTHTVYWPTMLKAMGLPLPQTIFAHGWWLVGRDKMSKSSGNVVNPMAFAERYGVDPFRYFLMAEMTLGQDASFTEEAFVRRYNADLANDLGNLLNRVMKLIGKYGGGCIPEPADGAAGGDEIALRKAALETAGSVGAAVEGMRLDEGLARVAGLTREVNRYMERRRPWDLGREGRLEDTATVLYHAAEALRIVSGLLFPVMPNKMAELRRALGVRERAPDMGRLQEWGVLGAGVRIGEMRSLFPRIQDASGTDAPGGTEGRRTGGAGRRPERSKEEKVEITYADFEKLDLRTARIDSAEKVEGADKLLRLQIDVGGEKRQIVAGIARHYKPEDLAGRTIVVVANLKPATIRGVESRGMLLAASSGDTLRLVTVDGDVPGGSAVS
ncbi:MAG: methionine--tRNA ligase [Lentisphaerae bacterium]|nr:methionine--tRNA ligase [Lentisphaerota bacterium]